MQHKQWGLSLAAGQQVLVGYRSHHSRQAGDVTDGGISNRILLVHMWVVEVEVEVACYIVEIHHSGLEPSTDLTCGPLWSMTGTEEEGWRKNGGRGMGTCMSSVQ